MSGDALPEETPSGLAPKVSLFITEKQEESLTPEATFSRAVLSFL